MDPKTRGVLSVRKSPELQREHLGECRKSEKQHRRGGNGKGSKETGTTDLFNNNNNNKYINK